MADQTIQYQNGFAPEVAPYAQTLLGQAQAATDPNQNPYQTYSQWAQAQGLSGDQTAQFSGLQQNAFQQGQGLQQNPFSQNAATGTQQLLQNSWTNPGTAQSFMSPYTQNVVDAQNKEAQRQSGIQDTYNDAQATGAGAFGGSRQAIMDAESQRNLQTQMNLNEATGLQNSYNQGMSQYNTQQGQGLAGLSNLGSMGQNLYGQTTGNINLQDQLGTQQQQQAQNMINTNVNNYQQQQNYPYKQLGFMSDIIHGSPTTAQSYQTTSAAPSTLGTVASLGTIGAGLLGKAKGGAIRAYNGGGLATLLAHSIG